MARRMVDVTLDNLDDLPSRCRACAFWELDPAAGERVSELGESLDTAMEKEAWVSDTLLEWGRCGQLAYVDGVAAGYVLYAPAAYVPRSASFPTAPISSDAVLLMSARVLPQFGGKGVGRSLIQAVTRDAARRGIKAVEAFGYTGIAGEHLGACLLPAGYLRAVGFKTVRQHPHTPRLRLEVRAPVWLRADLESTVDRLLGALPARAH